MSTDVSAFTGIEAAIGDRVVTTPTGATFHRPALLKGEEGDVEPACQAATSDRWYVLEPERARRSGQTPCARCWRPILEYLALDETSRVGYAGEARGATPELDGVSGEGDRFAADGTGELFEPPGRERVAIAALTDEVLVLPGSNIFHAPADDNASLCGVRGEFRWKPREVIPHHDPCKSCYVLESEG